MSSDGGVPAGARHNKQERYHTHGTTIVYGSPSNASVIYLASKPLHVMNPRLWVHVPSEMPRDVPTSAFPEL